MTAHEYFIQHQNKALPRPVPQVEEEVPTLSELMYAKLLEMAEWVAPCTFKRTNRAPLDSKSCFATLESYTSGDNSVETYLNETYSTAYPGQVIAVTDDSTHNGLYVLMEDVENGRLVPTRLGTASEINAASASAVMNWLNADGTEA